MTQQPTALLDTSHVNFEQPPFVLIDGSYYLFRTFHALPIDMKNSQGLHTNAIRGTLNAINKLINRYQPTHMAIAFDTKSPTFRHKLSAIYKGDRPKMPEELAEQIPYIHRMIQTLGIKLLCQEGVEADDIIGTLAHKACKQGHHVIISTGDKDMCQLVNNAILVENSFDDKRYNVQGVQEKFGVAPYQIVDYLTLMGDASDGIQGVAGIGEVTAKKLLTEYHTIDNILANIDKLKGKQKQTLIDSTDSIRLDKKLATIITDLDLVTDWNEFKLPTDPSFNFAQKTAIFTELEFKAELKSLEKLANQADQPLSNKPTLNQKANKQPTTKTNHTTIDNEEDFLNLVRQLERTTCFVIATTTTNLNWQTAHLTGLAFAFNPHHAYYIPINHVNDVGERLKSQLSADFVLSKLKNLLENPNIAKIGHHLKYDSHILANYGINLAKDLANWQTDIMLASYVLNTVATRHDLDDLARHYLHKTITNFTDLVGKGAKQMSFAKVDLAVASQYACENTIITWQLFELFNKQLTANDKQLLHKIEMPIAQILCHMEDAGILLDKSFLTKLSVEFDRQIQQLESTAHAQAGETFNLASPKQLGEILFDKLKLPGGKKTKTGQYSTSEQMLIKIDHELVDTILAYRGLAKLKSTYTDTLAKASDSQNRVHTSYHQALTSTGRLSSTNPNLQNIPIRSHTGRLIRQAFIAPTGRKIVSADYSQIELRLMAHFANDPALILAFNEGHDIHRATASEILNKPFDAITNEERRQAKAVNFGLLYGMSEFGLAKQLRLNKQQAQDYIRRYFSRYPAVKSYMQATRRLAYEQGFVTTILGRKIHIPNLENSNALIRQAAERGAINAPLQGSASDIIKLAMLAVDDILPKDKTKMLLQVHDELIFEADEHKAYEIGELIKNTMQNVFCDTAKKLGWQVDFAVPLLVEVGVGDNWDSAH
ncbi:DNA polymerase I [Moraxella macacae 0408225]|uniref:DNA polymerase I n=1 Tax=Moraxella macacae 0408225 TaxID=1230338 RepID=L2F871_9GAMM|nr:DNA polymerase I [Moraxella macacae]ELA08976.1 DNA polymerase I [Moraxella macacae 0408225]